MLDAMFLLRQVVQQLADAVSLRTRGGLDVKLAGFRLHRRSPACELPPGAAAEPAITACAGRSPYVLSADVGNVLAEFLPV